MPSTYSPNLALELIGTGDQAGTWGNTTNTNLGTLIEQAISGYEVQSLTSGTTLTLTIPNGATGVARNMYLEFTGNGSTVIVPSNKKLYFVYNNCTSGTVTMKVAGQTGVAVAKGSKQILVSNGTDIQEAISAGVEGVTTTSLTAYGVDAGDSVTSGGGNTVVGHQAGTDLTTGALNTFVGEYAGWKQVSGTINTAVGRFSGAYGTGYTGCTYMGHGAGIYRTSNANTGIGYQALAGNVSVASTGYSNTAVGYSALNDLTTGYQNVAVGNGANIFLTTGARNTALGVAAASAMTTAIGCTAVGHSALYTYTTSAGNDLSYNVALGHNAGYSLAGSNGSYACTFIGGNAGYGCTTGTFVTALGFEALNSGGSYSNITGVGSSTAVTGNNQVQLGDASTTTYAYGSVQNRSDARDKTEIKDTELGLDFIMALRPRDFKWDMREDYRTSVPIKPQREDYETEEAYEQAVATWNVDFAAWQEASKLANITHDGTHTRTRYHHGLIAQEVKQTMDSMGVDFGGYQDHSLKGGDAVLSIGYEELVAPLIKAIQELKAEFDEYKRTHP
jgi:hypothetical protein